ncbi:MAG: MATE family efflux transporter [Synergistaceae bacterium]|nr:MATE family efflux transporter [Synergistaceae bacterium]
MRDMSRGSIGGQILLFSFPLMLANVFQQLYGVMNSVVVGRYLGKEALAATGTAIPLMNIMMFLIVGITMGASVLMAEYFGAGDEKKLRDEADTAMTAGLIFTLLLSAAGALFVAPALRLIQAPPEILPQAAAYLRIICLGFVFAFFYNHFSSAMRAVGESAAPLCFLILSSLLNIALAVLFVGKLGGGVEGAAWATVISQAFSALLCLAYIFFRIPALRPEGNFLRIKGELLKKTLSYASVSGIQQAVLYIGIFLLQGAVNPLGIDAIAAFNSVSRIDGLVMAPGDSLASALMMFVSQNRGARREDRVRLGLMQTHYLSFAVTALCAAVIFAVPERLAALFLNAGEETAIAEAARFLRIMSLFYLFSPCCNTFQGFFRGAGRMDVTFYATLVQIPLRVALAYLLAGALGMEAVAVAIAAGWIFMAAYQLFEYSRYLRAEGPVEGGRSYGFGL